MMHPPVATVATVPMPAPMAAPLRVRCSVEFMPAQPASPNKAITAGMKMRAIDGLFLFMKCRGHVTRGTASIDRRLSIAHGQSVLDALWQLQSAVMPTWVSGGGDYFAPARRGAAGSDVEVDQGQ